VIIIEEDTTMAIIIFNTFSHLLDILLLSPHPPVHRRCSQNDIAIFARDIFLLKLHPVLAQTTILNSRKR
jgi:hypothetical protein